MKKLKGIGLVMALSTFLSGCTLNSPGDIQVTKPIDQEIETVSLRVWGGEYDQELLSGMIETFKEEYKDEAKFDIVLEPVNEAICKSTLLSDLNNAPDVFGFADDQLLELAASGVLAPLALSEQVSEANVEGSIEAASINGQLYAYPLTADNGYFMFYNKAYFNDKDLESLDDMLKIAANNNKKVTFKLDDAWYLYSFFGNTGLTMGLNDDNLTNHCDWNSKTNSITGVDVGNTILNITRHPGFSYGGDPELTAGAANGTVIAGVNGIWLASELQELWGDNFGATKLPTYNCAGQDIQMSSYAGYKLVASNAYSPNKEWADKLAMWFGTPENQLLRFQQRGNGPSNKEAANSPEVQSAPQVNALIMQSDYASLQRVGDKYWIPAQEFGEKMLRGELSTNNMQSALDEMVKGITESIGD